MTDHEGSLQGLQTAEQFASATAMLLSEVGSVLASNHWAIINSGSDSSKYRLYLAAALRHTCDVLLSVMLAAQAGDELGVRILGRAHLEAWLTAAYLRFGGTDALDRIAADTLYQTKLANDEIKRTDTELGKARKDAQKKLKKVQETNPGISLWNTQHPDQPKPLLPEPHVPKQPKAEIDLSLRIADFAGVEAKNLPLGVIVDQLTKLGPEEGFANESFAQLYIYYRLMSGVSAHPTVHLYDSYFEPPNGYFVHTSARPTGSSVILATWSTALYATALLVGWVLRDDQYSTPVADMLRAQLEPDPATTGGWAPGTPDDT